MRQIDDMWCSWDYEGGLQYAEQATAVQWWAILPWCPAAAR